MTPLFFQGKPGRPMSESARRVLAFLREHPGATVAEIQSALPLIPAIRKINNLRDQCYVRSERVPGTKCCRYYCTARVSEQMQLVKVRGPARGPIAQPREHDYRAVWSEPYLSDAGVRSEGLQYRDCPSRRGSTLVYCYRRPA